MWVLQGSKRMSNIHSLENKRLDQTAITHNSKIVGHFISPMHNIYTLYFTYIHIFTLYTAAQATHLLGQLSCPSHNIATHLGAFPLLQINDDCIGECNGNSHFFMHISLIST